MKQLIVLALALASLAARAEPASEASVMELLQVTRAEAMVESMYGSIEQSMRQGMQQAIGGRPLSAEQQRIFDDVPRQFIQVVREEAGWQKLLPDFVRIYRETFEQAEIDGLLAFYRTPAGRALIEKTPLVMQKSVAVSQAKLQTMIPKMQAAMQQAVTDIKAAK